MGITARKRASTVVAGGGIAGTADDDVLTVQGIAGAVPVIISGTFTVSGLASAIIQTVTSVGAAAVPVPAVALAGRATMLIQNVGITIIYIGSSTVTADTTATGGVQLLAGQSLPIDITDAITLYAISSAAGGIVATVEVA